MARTAALPILTAEPGLTHYLEEIRRVPMLERQEEYMLAKRWREHGDREAAHKLVTSRGQFHSLRHHPFANNLKGRSSREKPKEFAASERKLRTLEIGWVPNSILRSGAFSSALYFHLDVRFRRCALKRMFLKLP